MEINSKLLAINYTLFKIIAAKYVRILTLHVKKNIFFCFLIFNDAKKRQAKCPHLEKGFLKLGRPGFLVLAKNDCIMYLYHITNNVHQRKGERVFFYTGCKKKSNQISCFLLQNFWKDLVHNFGLKGN